jgi:hypothetical protein
MLTTRRLALATAAILAIGACGGSTAPPEPLTPAQIARHIDSLWAGSGSSGRGGYLLTAELGPALGAAPTSVILVTPAGDEVWQAFTYRCQGCGSADSTYALVAYSDYALTSILVATVQYETQQGSPHVVQAVSILTDTSLLSGGSGTLTLAATATGSACVLATGLQANFSQYATGCSLATFSGGLTWSFSTTAVQIRSQTFNGVEVK